MKKDISKKKQKEIDTYIKKPFVVSDDVYVQDKSLYTYGNDKLKLCTILSINGSNVCVSYGGSKYTIKKTDIVSKFCMYIGADPFDKTIDRIQNINYTLECILSTLGILDNDRDKYYINDILVRRCNWNPYIYKDGKKYYYQRKLIWTDKDKKLLIESIYQNIDCGKILIRNRGCDELESMKGESELAFKDIVDGKQRLDAIRSFINNEFSDIHGNYYGDLSEWSQRKLLDHQLFSYSELPENSLDNDVINQFLKLNFTGVVQSKEHLEYVKGLRTK